MHFIDLNCDLGENTEENYRTDDAALMPLISSCNIACGQHGGTDEVTYNAIHLAKEHSVKIGAHPSFPDRKNFGRVQMDLPDEDLRATLLAQIELIQDLCNEVDLNMHHVKPHGALYNRAFHDMHVAHLIAETIYSVDPSLIVYCQPNSQLSMAAKKLSLRVHFEAFGDRTYQDDGSLTSRTLPNAILEDPTKVLNQIVGIARNKEVHSLSGKIISMPARTCCIHGDHTNAVEILTYLNQELPKHDINWKHG